MQVYPYAVTISPHVDTPLTDDQTRNILSWFSAFNYVLVTREERTDGTPHLHILYRDIPHGTHNISRKINTMMKRFDIPCYIGVTVRVKKAGSPRYWAGYCMKEIESEEDLDLLFIQGYDYTWAVDCVSDYNSRVLEDAKKGLKSHRRKLRWPHATKNTILDVIQDHLDDNKIEFQPDLVWFNAIWSEVRTYMNLYNVDRLRTVVFEGLCCKHGFVEIATNYMYFRFPKEAKDQGKA